VTAAASTTEGLLTEREGSVPSRGRWPLLWQWAGIALALGPRCWVGKIFCVNFWSDLLCSACKWETIHS